MSESKTTYGAENIYWDLSDLYDSVDGEAIKSDKEKIIELADLFAQKYRTHVAELSAPGFKEALQDLEKIYDLLGRMGSYAHLIWSTNTGESAYGKLMSDITELGSAIGQKLIFFEVEWLRIDEEKAKKIINDVELKKYQHYLEVSRLLKPYTLSEQEEQILTAKSVTSRQAWTRFFDETMGAARFEFDGEQLSEQELLSKLHESDREVRKRAAQVLTDKFKEMSHPLTYIFNTILADKQISDNLRNFPSWITSRNLSNEIKDETVETLVKSVTDKYTLVHRFYDLKRKILGYDKLMDYDRYAPILETQTRIQWDEARNIVTNSYSNFHPEMGNIVTRFFDKKWIDAAMRPGKRSGAYSASTVPSVHPYVFLNYDGRIRDVQTLAHELGHGIHQYVSRKQGIFEADTPLTTAETASVFGEMLAFQSLYKKIEDPREKLAMLIGKIDDTIATVFRQVSMNRFENAMHTTRREQGELTTQQFSKLWRETQEAIYGDSVEITENYDLWWSYIPHFLHTPGYVYAYAFGELLVLALYEQYTRKPEGFADRYLELLSAGGSDWPEHLISKMGFDINSPDFWQKGLRVIEGMIEEAEKLAEITESNV
ncbi:MAG TPA: M3 family oligoendopeptidase [Balneolales bacterium]|nr:M3 family oligoendopeptidase [Balneolales bacterium]